MKQNVNVFLNPMPETNKANRAENRQEDRITFFHERARAFGRRFAGFDPLATETMLDLIYTSDVVSTKFAAFLHPFDLSPSAFNVLMVLRLAPERDFKMHEIGKMLVVTRANVTLLINNLARKELVERTKIESDKRARLIRITATGEKLLERILPEHFLHERQVLSFLSDEEKQTLRGLLIKVRESAKIN